MKTVILNGSPRRKGNTAVLCDAFRDGIISVSPDSEVISYHLNDFTYKGCQSCFACKLKGSKSYGRCSYQDALSPILEEIMSADILVVATPIYLMDATSSVKSLLERLCFSLGSYELRYKSLANNKPVVVTIYTMNCTEEYAPVHAMDNMDMFLGHVFTEPHRICAYNTYQFHDYPRYKVEVFDEKEKAAYRQAHWREDIRRVTSLATIITTEHHNSSCLKV